MKYKQIISYFLFLFSTQTSISLCAQSDSLVAVFNKTKLLPGDTVEIDFNLLSKSANLNKATINCIVTGIDGFEKRMRWPLINKSGVVQLVVDKNLVKGFYKFIFFVQEGIFRINGELTASSKVKTVKAVLINSKGQINIEEVVVDNGNKFVFKNYIFENYANLFFSSKSGNRNRLDIKINAVLDSAYKPAAITGGGIIIGDDNVSALPALLNLTAKDSVSYNSAEYLQEVIVYSDKKETVDRYEENYVGGIFRDAESKSFSLLDDPLAQSSTDIFEYIQMKVPNIRISYNQSGDAVVKMRNTPVFFYLDEMQLDVSYIRNISVSDIAVIKVFQPPFIGNNGGNGGAVAIYTRRGGDVITKSSGNSRFRVKGYTPALSVLSAKE